jgi:hypothetical protein
MRGLHRVVLPLASLAVACGGGDLTLPGPGDPATLSIVSGDGQRATVGEPVSEPLVVQLVDGSGRPVPRATVLFRFSDDPPDAAVDPTSPTTDSLGRASANARLGSTPGDQTIDAQVARPGTDLQVHFRLTALARPTDNGGEAGGEGGGGGGGGGEGSGGPSPSGGSDGSGGGGGGSGGGDGGGGHDGGGHGHGHGEGGSHGHGD